MLQSDLNFCPFPHIRTVTEPFHVAPMTRPHMRWSETSQMPSRYQLSASISSTSYNTCANSSSTSRGHQKLLTARSAIVLSCVNLKILSVLNSTLPKDSFQPLHFIWLSEPRSSTAAHQSADSGRGGEGGECVSPHLPHPCLQWPLRDS